MSLIHVGCGEGSPTVEKLYHHVQIDSPRALLSIVGESSPGTVRYEVLLKCDRDPETLYFGVPYPSVRAIRDATGTFQSKTEQRLLGENQGDSIRDGDDKYTIQSFDEDQRNTKRRRAQGFDYTLVELDTGEGFQGQVAFGIEVEVDDIATNVANSLIEESTWALDLTLYGPIHPREHRFLETEERSSRTVISDLGHTVLTVKQAYTYLFLPHDSFPKTVSPTPLESFYYGSEANFYYTWTCGHLDPWYEQRMLVTYGSYNNNIVAALLIGVLASLLVSVVTGISAIL